MADSRRYELSGLISSKILIADDQIIHWTSGYFQYQEKREKPSR
jgi:hypothetical protein